MHHRIYHCRAILLFLSFVTVISCNILEDRDECPCRLLFKAIDLPEGMYEPVIYIYEGDIMKERIEVPQGRLTEGYVHEIARNRDIVAYVWCDTTGRFGFPIFDLDGIEISGEYGEALPALFRYGASIDTRAESLTLEIDFNKRFAALSATVIDPGEITGIAVSGSNNGYLMDGTPLCKEFLHRPEFSRHGGYVTFTSFIPEQTDDNLEIILENADGSENRIPLGRILRREGYNWDAEDLIDISIRIEGGTVGLTLKSSEWDDGYDKDLTI